MTKNRQQDLDVQGNKMCEIMTESQLAEHLNVTVYTVRKMRLKEGLPTLKFDNIRAILYYRPAVDDWLRARSLPWNEEKDVAQCAEGKEKEGKGGQTKYSMAPIPD